MAWAACHTFRSVTDLHVVVSRQIVAFVEQHSWESVGIPALHQYEFAFRQQALSGFVVPDVFTRATIEHQYTFTLAGSIHNVHNSGRQHDTTLLVGIYPRVVKRTCSFLHFAQHLHAGRLRLCCEYTVWSEAPQH